MRKMASIMVASLGLALMASAQAQTYDIKDTTPNGDSPTVRDTITMLQKPGANWGVVGDERQYPAVGYPSNEVGARYTMYRFDLSSIPSGSAISWATFNVHFESHNGPAITGYKLSRFKAGKDWIEGLGYDIASTSPGEPTWNSQKHQQVAWQTPGATGANDIDLATTKTFDKQAGVSEWKTFDVKSWVVDWVNNGVENNGMLMWGGTGPGGVALNYWVIWLSEWPDINMRPYLHIELVGTPPVVSPVADDSAIQGVEYTEQCSVSQGSPVTWSLLEGPTGAVIDPNTGRVSGWTPSDYQMGLSFHFKVQATNPYGNDTEEWNVTVRVAGNNNGFITDYVYSLKDNPTAHTVTLKVWDEATGGWVADLRTFAYDAWWESLTFSGGLVDGDARLFIARGTGTPDIEVAEINSTGSTVHSNTLSTIVGSLGTNFAFGTIRFSRGRPTSLFLSAASDKTGTSRGMAWEIDLGLSTLKNTYTGPINPLPVNDDYCAAYCDVAPDGTLYMIGQHLGRSTDVLPTEPGKGDLVSFDTSGGSTSSFTKLIDGPTYWPGDDRWDRPSGVAFRSANPDDDTPTILIGQQSDAYAREVLEFYLDTTAHPKDGNGNLTYRPGTKILVRRPYRGQQDEVSGSVWWASTKQGVHELKSDDTVSHVDNGSPLHAHEDADSPAFLYEPCNTPFADVDDDGDVDQDDFAVFQLCYSLDPPPGGLTATCACLDQGDDDSNGRPDRDGDIDQTDLAVFQRCASGPGVPAEPDCGD